MPKGDHCSVWGCDNDRRYPERLLKKEHVDRIRFFKCKDVKKISVWKKAIGRTDKPFKLLKGSPCVCSNHFEHGRPTTDKPYPTLFLKGYEEKKELKKERRILKRHTVSAETRKPRKTARNSNQSLHGFPETSVGPTSANLLANSTHCMDVENESNVFMDNVAAVSDSNDIICPPPYSDHNYSIQGNTCCARSEKFSSHNDGVTEDTDCKGCLSLKKKILELEHDLLKATEKITELEQQIASPFDIKEIKSDNSLVETYTGLPNYGVFEFLVSKLEPKTEKLQYYKGKRSQSLKKYQSVQGKRKPERKRQLTVSQELFLTLCRLRQNLSVDDLAYRFKTSVSNVSTILSTWLAFLAKELKGFMCWPKQEDLGKFYPEAFRPFPGVCAIVDCTEIFLQRPSLAEAQALTYSSYKSHNTAKYLLCITPAGTVSFVSKGYGGLSSDRHIFNDSGIINHFQRGSSCMVDRGFVIQDLLLSRGVKVYMPPFTKGQKQFTKDKVNQGQAIAKARIHVERAIQRVKRYRIFQSVIPLSLKDLLDDIVVTCSALTNLMPPLIGSKY